MINNPNQKIYLLTLRGLFLIIIKQIVALHALSCVLQERVKSVFHAKEFGKIINFKTPEIAKVS